MRKMGAGVIAGVAVTVALMWLTTAVDAQVRRERLWGLEMMLQGGGSEVGASVRDLNADETAKAKLPQPGGVFVEMVHEGSAAARAGLMNGDIVVAFDGERVRGVRHFMRLVRETPPGRAVTASLVRAGSRRDVQITPDSGDRGAGLAGDIAQLERRLRALPAPDLPDDLDPTPDLKVAPRGQIGVTLAPLTEQLADYFGVSEGVLVSSVTTGSAAAQGGLRAGDVITAVNGRAARNVGDVTRAVRDAKPGTALDMRVFRDKKETSVKVLVPERITQPRSVLPV